LTAIADRYAVDGQKEKSAEILSHALQVAEAIDQESLKSRTRGWNFFSACRLLVGILTPAQTFSFKSTTLAEIAEKYADIGQTEKAREILSQLDIAEVGVPPYIKATAAIAVAAAYTKAALYDQALAIANAIEDSKLKSGALAEIARKYVETGQYDQALQVANTIEEASLRCN